MKNSEALARMKSVYKDALSFLSAPENKEREYIGCLGNDIPEEILIAGGYTPIWIQGKSALTLRDADQYLEYSFSPVIRAKFQLIADGTYNSVFDRLVISNSSDTYVRIYFYLREMKRLEPQKPIPDMYFHDFLFTRRRMNQVYNYGKIIKFKETVESWRGKAITDEDIKRAIAICNENRTLLKEVSSRRISGKLSGSDCAAIYGSSLLMPKVDHNALIKEFLSQDDYSEVEGAKILLIGSVQEEDALHQVVEECGGNIVFEDHDWGDRLHDLLVQDNADSFAAVSDRYMLRSPGTNKSFVSARVETLKNQIELVKPCGVLFFNRIYDDPASWDYPEQIKLLNNLQIPHLALDSMPYDLQGDTTIRQRLGEFVEKISLKRGE